ncbi:endonuclease/exonuclease/phosphatase family protein [Kitasatospora sp. NPDC052896]|uniref:endonuclease/exonuclease/phosphatase family protein n=1 Tax=Kitasatospora sp. NPDC052896 TaxID=3364061 RepID=UPI0037C6FC97
MAPAEHQVSAGRQAGDASTLTVATLNTRGSPLSGTHRAERSAAIGAEFEHSPVGVVGFQEVHTYCHLKQLRAHLPTFAHVAYVHTPVGPAGGLVTFSRTPFAETRFERFGRARGTSGMRWRTRVIAALNGSLITRVAGHDLHIVNTHPVANHDGDWSEANRFHALQSSQYAALAQLVRELSPRVVVIGDFNAPRESAVHATFIAETGLRDVFGHRCPPTFHAEYLGPGQAPQCVDFILAAGDIVARHAELILDQEVAMPFGRGFVSDHLGLRADLLLHGY